MGNLALSSLTEELLFVWQRGTGLSPGEPALLTVDSRGRIVRASTAAAVLLDACEADLRGRSLLELVPDEQEHREAIRRCVDHALDPDLQPSERSARFPVMQADGERRVVEAAAAFVPDAIGGGHFILRLVDVTEDAHRERELRAATRQLHAITRHSVDLIVVIGPDWEHRFVSGSAERVLGYEPEELTATVFRDAVHPEDREGVRRALAELRRSGASTRTLEYRMRRRDGSLAQVASTVINADLDPDVRGLVLYTRDVGHRLRLDPATELPTRAPFLEQVSRIRAHHADQLSAIVVLSIDRLPIVRARWGQGAADSMAGEVATRLLGLAPAPECVARVGPDSFAVLLPVVESDDAEHTARHLARELGRPFRWAGGSVRSPASAGIALSNLSSGDADAFLRAAEAAAVRAAADQRGPRVADSDVLGGQEGELLLEADLAGAIRRDELFLVYQPIRELRDGRTRAFEALIRWRHRTRGVVPPAQFIPVAEASGLIVPLGLRALEKACATARELIVPGGDRARIHVNVSAVQLTDDEFPDIVRDALRGSGLEPGLLELELTETALVDRPERARAVLDELKDLGVRLSLDDFGTGWSSLASLQRFPIDTLKIDRAFISGETGLGTPRGLELVRAILAMARALDIEVIAEGIERPEHASVLLDLGCGLGQGWLLGRPMDVREALLRLQEQAA